MTEATNWDEREEKGRVGEDIVTLGFRMRGYRVHRVGIEYSGFINANMSDALKRDALFTQMRKLPDFLLTKGETHHFVEVKFRSDPDAWKSTAFLQQIVTTYLGRQKNPREGEVPNHTGILARTAQKYWPMFENLNLMLITPNEIKVAKVKDFFARRQVKETIVVNDRRQDVLDWHMGAKEGWCDAWNVPNPLSDDVLWFKDVYYKALIAEAMPLWLAKFSE